MLAQMYLYPSYVTGMIPSIALVKENQALRSALLRPILVCIALGSGLAACAPSQPGQPYDPVEPLNRQVHALNRGLDKAVIRPVAVATKGKGEIAGRISNFADNLGKPADVVNNILQLRLGKAAQNTLRFGFNTVFGLGGIHDIASEAGMPKNDTDFGETLHVWGVGEGPYLEVPLMGPSTLRDFFGALVDAAIDPLNSLPDREALAATAIKVTSKIADRGRYSDTVDSILYDSADSYVQARLLYLQNRRFELGQVAEEAGFVDPYEDPYAE
jgi:phospholipid-binding lipoprotein MlaA